jgi:hypothetical protein
VKPEPDLGGQFGSLTMVSPIVRDLRSRGAWTAGGVKTTESRTVKGATPMHSVLEIAVSDGICEWKVGFVFEKPRLTSMLYTSLNQADIDTAAWKKTTAGRINTTFKYVDHYMATGMHKEVCRKLLEQVVGNPFFELFTDAPGGYEAWAVPHLMRLHSVYVPTPPVASEHLLPAAALDNPLSHVPQCMPALIESPFGLGHAPLTDDEISELLFPYEMHADTPHTLLRDTTSRSDEVEHSDSSGSDASGHSSDDEIGGSGDDTPGDDDGHDAATQSSDGELLATVPVLSTRPAIVALREPSNQITTKIPDDSYEVIHAPWETTIVEHGCEKTTWQVDTGAGCCVCNSASLMCSLTLRDDVVLATVAGNHTQRVTGVGECKVLVPSLHGGRSCVLHLKNVMLVPESPFNLISVVRLESATQTSGSALCRVSRGCACAQ